MRIAVAQMTPKVGSIEDNLERHVELVDLAVKGQADLVIFPELSLTGYEPVRAAELSRDRDDPCFASFQVRSDRDNIVIGVGFPLKTDGLPRIATQLFRPRSSSQVYSKYYLHADEEPFFESGRDLNSTIYAEPKIALAICYELAVPEHARSAFNAGASVYIASSAKTARGVEEADRRLTYLAKEQSAIIMLANSIGRQDDVECCGRSAVWGRDGRLLAQLGDSSDGIIVIDYGTEEVATDVL